MPRIPLPNQFAHQPFTTREGSTAGLGAKRMQGRDLQKPFRGVRVHSSHPLDFIERCRAYQQQMPQHAYYCGPTAARIMGIPLPPNLEKSTTLDVAVPVGHRAPTGRTIRGHTYATAPEHIRLWDGLRISDAERTWCALGATLSLTELVASGDFLIHHRLPFTSIRKLVVAVADHTGRRGRKVLREALPLLDDRSESAQESILRVIIVRGGILGTIANLPIRTSGGYHYRGDLAIADSKLIIEYQSRFHDGVKEFRSDMTRISRLEADGWYVMQVNNDDLNDAPELLQRIRTVLQTRSHLR